MPLFEPVQHLGCTTGGGGHEVGVLVQAEGHAVVEDHAVQRAHDAVAGRTRCEFLERVGVDAVQEFTGVLATDLDLAQGGGVHEADGIADCGALAEYRGVHVLAILRVVPGALPLSNVLEQCALGNMPRVDGRDAGRVKKLSALASGQSSEGNRGERCTVGRGADLADARNSVRAAVLERCGDDTDCVDAGGLALVIGGADAGVPLDVFHRTHAGTCGTEDIGHGLVALEVDEVVVPLTRLAGLARNQPQLAGRVRSARTG